MTTQTLTRPTTTAQVTIGVVGFAVALAMASQVAVPLPGTPVPITLQPFVVVLAGLWLGPRAAAASMVLYLIAGALGLPVFAPAGIPGVARLLGPTGGYLLAYPLAAATTGLIADRRARFPGNLLATLAGIAVLYLGGLAQLALLTGSLRTAAILGIMPFIALDALKALAAAALGRTRSTPRALT